MPQRSRRSSDSGGQCRSIGHGAGVYLATSGPTYETPAEIRECSIGECTCVPHDKVAHCPDLEKLARDQTIVLVCGSGQRATIAGKALAEKGFTKLVVMEGGMQEWRKCDLPAPLYRDVP